MSKELRFTMEIVDKESVNQGPKWGFVVPLKGKGTIADVTPELVREAMEMFQLSISTETVGNWAAK